MVNKRDDDPNMAQGARSVIDRALAVLESFHGGRARQSLSEISRETGLPIATCYRIVGRLAEWGALERDGDARYRIGLRLWEVASHAPRAVGLQRLVRPYIQDLYETTGYASHFAIRDGLELVSIERFQSPRRMTRRPLTGLRYPMHATAIGQVLLAYAPSDIREQVLSGGLEAFTPRTYVDRESLERVLSVVADKGYAISDRQVDNVHIGLAAPVRAAGGDVIGALSLALTEKDGDANYMVHPVRLTAASITRALVAAGFDNSQS